MASHATTINAAPACRARKPRRIPYWDRLLVCRDHVARHRGAYCSAPLALAVWVAMASISAGDRLS